LWFADANIIKIFNMPKASILSSIFHLPSSKKKSLRLILFLFFLVLASCSQQSKRADLVVITGAEPESLDPVIVTGQVDQNIVSELFEGLTRFNKAGLSEPGIAASWDVSFTTRCSLVQWRADYCS